MKTKEERKAELKAAHEKTRAEVNKERLRLSPILREEWRKYRLAERRLVKAEANYKTSADRFIEAGLILAQTTSLNIHEFSQLLSDCVGVDAVLFGTELAEVFDNREKENHGES
jgi:hypothetical protein